eukprot:3761477-Amphidinium_carterae.1
MMNLLCTPSCCPWRGPAQTLQKKRPSLKRDTLYFEGIHLIQSETRLDGAQSFTSKTKNLYVHKPCKLPSRDARTHEDCASKSMTFMTP